MCCFLLKYKPDNKLGVLLSNKCTDVNKHK